MIGKALVGYSEPELVAAIKANWVEFFRFVGRSSSTELDESPGLTRLSCAMPWALFSRVLRTNLTPDRVDAAIEETIAYYESRDVDGFSWWLMPDMQPADLGEYLESHGFALREGPSGMAVDLAKVDEELTSPASLSIQVVGDEDTLSRWNHIVASCFGIQDHGGFFFDLWLDLGFDLPIRSYLGLLNGEPVATSLLFLAAGVAGIYMVAVIPEARRQGIGAAMTLAPLLDACAQGYRVGILHALQMGYNAYRRIGFQEYCKMSHYVWKRELEGAT